MKSKKMIPLMSAVTGILVLTMVILLFTIGPLKKSSEDKSLILSLEGSRLGAVIILVKWIIMNVAKS